MREAQAGCRDAGCGRRRRSEFANRVVELTGSQAFVEQPAQSW